LADYSSAERAEELIAHLSDAIGERFDQSPQILRFYREDERRAGQELQMDFPSGDRHRWASSSVPEISQETAAWVSDWMEEKGLQEAFALVIDLTDADFKTHLSEEAKLAAAVCHGKFRLFGSEAQLPPRALGFKHGNHGCAERVAA
jgi:hypothetical protein